MTGFWLRVADLVVTLPAADPGASAWPAWSPWRSSAPRPRPNYSQLADLDPDQPSVDRAPA